MAVRKATMQQQVAQSIYQQNPTDRPIVTIHCLRGPSPLAMALLTNLWLLFVDAYFITVTEQALVVQRASKWTSRPLEIVHVMPREQAAHLIGDVQPRTLWSHFRFHLPGREKPSRINVNRQWKQEMEYLVQVLHQALPAQQPYAGQPFPGQQPYPGQPYAGQQPYPGGQFPPQAAPQQQAPFPPYNPQ